MRNIVGYVFILILSFILLGGSAMATETKLAVGDKAPEFTLTATDGSIVSSKGLLGQVYVVYFYPKDDTPGCTTEACSFRDDISEFNKIGVKVYGISLDSVESHKKFTSKYNLNFPLLSDADHSVAKAYGVLNGIGPLQVAKRTTFIIDKNGNIAKIFEGVNPAGHSREVLDAVKAIK